jgi:hypothetical protein
MTLCSVLSGFSEILLDQDWSRATVLFCSGVVMRLDESYSYDIFK